MHVTTFLHKLHSPKKNTTYWKTLSFLDHDIRSRAQTLSQLGLLPTFFGQTISGVARQKYHGDVTIVPSFTSAETMGIKAVFNPGQERGVGVLNRHGRNNTPSAAYAPPSPSLAPPPPPSPPQLPLP